MSKMSLFPEISNSLTADELGLVTEDIGVSYGDLAKRINVDRKTITRWLDGERPVPGSVALLLRVAHLHHRLFGHAWHDEGIAADDPLTTRMKL